MKLQRCEAIARDIKLTVPYRIAGRSFRVSRRPRTISIRLTPGRQPVRLRAKLAAGGRRSTATLTVPRRV